MYTSVSAIRQDYSSLVWSISSSFHSFTLTLEISSLDITRLYTDQYGVDSILSAAKEVFDFKPRIEKFRKSISESIQGIDDINYAQYFVVSSLRLLEVVNMVDFVVKNINETIEVMKQAKQSLKEEDFAKMLEMNKKENTEIVKGWIKNINSAVDIVRQILEPDDIDYTTYNEKVKG